MSHGRKSAVYAHFTESENSFKCSVETDGKTCEAVITKNKSDGSSAGNLKRHLKRAHPDQHDAVQESDQNIKKSAIEKGQTSLHAFLPSSKTTSITLKRKEFEDGILQMVAYDGVPLTFFTNPGFQTIAAVAAEKLGMKLGQSAIRGLILKRAKAEKDLLIQQLKVDSKNQHRLKCFQKEKRIYLQLFASEKQSQS